MRVTADHGWRELFAFLTVITWLATMAVALGWVAWIRHPTIADLTVGFLLGAIFDRLAHWP